MKKLLILICLVMALVSSSALAADSAPESSLWPAYDPETGLWGYIDAQGAWGIPPQYQWADDFEGDCAMVAMDEDRVQSGIIDMTGAFVLAPEYWIDKFMAGVSENSDNGNLFYVYGERQMGWFDVESRYFSGLTWDSCESWGDPRFILVERDGLCSLARRATGELLLPLQDLYAIGFYEGVALVENEERTSILHPDGSITPLAEGVEALDWAFEDGLLPVEAENGLCGYVGLDGQIAIEPQFENALAFSEGYGVVDNGAESLLIDSNGNVVAEDVLFVCGLWANGGVAVERTGCWAVLNADGTERFRIALEPYDYARFVQVHEPLKEDGPYWIEYEYCAVGTTFGLMTAEGEWLRTPSFRKDDHGLSLDEDRLSGDPMGWQATGTDGGYVDAYGHEIFPEKWLYTEHFNGALAFVRVDESTEGYINRAGEIVYQWTTPSALAADSAPEPSLWPAYDPETGLWGYIDAQGAWGIVPQYERAYHFHGGCAIVDMGDAPLWKTECTQGIIDETGAFLLPPEYIVFDFCDEGMEDIYFIMDNQARETEMMGWFNIPNRFFSGMHWYETYSCEGSPYVEIRVGNRDAQMGLADRATGEIVLPPDYTVSGLYVRDVEDGFLVAERADTRMCELIEIGKGPVPLPEGVTVDYGEGISEGLLVFEKDGLYGYLNTAGEIVIEAQFSYARAFWDGYASVTLPGDMDIIRLIDHQGQTVMTVMGIEDSWDGGYLGMVDGALFITWPDESWRLIEPDGRVRCQHEMPEHASYVWLYEVSPDAPILVRYDLPDDEFIFGLMSHEGEMLVPPCWEGVDAVDAQGWRAACLDGRWGYIDLYGSTMLPFVYEEAASFEGDLARVMLDASTEGYINRAGEVICQWPAPPED